MVFSGHFTFLCWAARAARPIGESVVSVFLLGGLLQMRIYYASRFSGCRWLAQASIMSALLGPSWFEFGHTRLARLNQARFHFVKLLAPTARVCRRSSRQELCMSQYFSFCSPVPLSSSAERSGRHDVQVQERFAFCRVAQSHSYDCYYNLNYRPGWFSSTSLSFTLTSASARIRSSF